MNSLSVKYEFVHGVFIIVNSVGLLLIGKPGVGKSTLAYELIMQGHTLVVDDIVKCQRHCQQLFGYLHNDKFKGQIYIRNRGLINIMGIHPSPAQSSGVINACIHMGNIENYEPIIRLCDVNIPFYNIKTGKASHIYSIIQRLSIS
jgi:serine kinase of HPr protein (carbohydrate metabolism regulator)